MTGTVVRRASMVAVGLALGIVTARGADRPVADEGRLRDHVRTLASPEFEGRSGPGARKAEAYVRDAFKALGLEPGFSDGSYTQDVPSEEPGEAAGRNVAARKVGSDPVLRDEWVVISAHYDHLGVRRGTLYPGADDNASGVAMLLEVARALSAETPRRSVLFVAFDLEEIALRGSRTFVAKTPIPLDRIKLFVTADMLGRSLGGVCGDRLFVMGSEHIPTIRPWLGEAARGLPLTLGAIGTDIVGTRSDYGPFRARNVPYLFFSTGENPCYHTPRDVPETIDYSKLRAATTLIGAIIRRAADAPSEALPTWSSSPENSLEEAVTIRGVLRTLADHRDELRIGAFQTRVIERTIVTLDAAIARGTITPGERSGMVRVAQFVMASSL